MKEKIKTLVLLSLISISISMTRNIWMKSPDEALAFVKYNNTIEESDYSLLNIISPSRYLLNFGSGSHTLLYDDYKYKIWDNGKSLLVDVFTAKDYETEEITREEFMTYNDHRSVVFKFSEKINTYILAKALKVKKPNELVNTLAKIDSVYVYLGEKSPFFVFTYGDQNLRVDLNELDTESIKKEIQKIELEKNYSYYYSMKDTLNIDNNVFIPYEINGSPADIYVDNMVLKYSDVEKDVIAESFLDKNIDYIKEIVEGNNTNIYTYNKKLLKLNSNGIIEYFNPLEGELIERNLYQSLTTASTFIGDKFKTSESIYLDKVEEIERDNSLGYRLTFKYRIRGIPLIIGNQEAGDYLSIEVFNNHIRSYIQYAREDNSIITNDLTKSESILSAFEVIDKNYPILEEKYLENNEVKDQDNLVNEILSSIDSVTLAYFDPGLKEEGEKLIPIWLVSLEDAMLAFDAYNGMLTYIKNI